MEGFRARKNVPERLHISNVVYIPIVHKSASMEFDKGKDFPPSFLCLRVSPGVGQCLQFKDLKPVL